MHFAVESGSGSGQYAPVPVGRYKGRIVHVVFVGSVPGYQGKIQGEVQIGFELDYRKADGSCAVIYKRFGASMHAMAKLRQMIEMLEARTLTNAEALSYSVTNLIGKQVWVQVGNKPGMQKPDGTVPVYDRIDGIYPSMEQWSGGTATLSFDVRKDDIGVLPQRLQKRVMESVEWQAKHGQQAQAFQPQQYAFGQQVATPQHAQQPVQYAQPAPPPPVQAPQVNQNTFGF